MSKTDAFLVEIGQRIYQRRHELGLTQEALAEKGNLTPQYVSYAELGKRAMRPEYIVKMAEALEVSVDYLVTGETVDKDMLIFSDKLRKLSPSQLLIIEKIVEECLNIYQLSEK